MYIWLVVTFGRSRYLTSSQPLLSPEQTSLPHQLLAPYSTPIVLLVPLYEKHDRFVQRLSLQMSSARERLIDYRVERRISFPLVPPSVAFNSIVARSDSV